MKRLLVVFHTQTGHTARMAQAVYRGASRSDVRVCLLRCFEAGADDLRQCDGVIFGTPENFGYMSGGLKDFFDRTYYVVEGEMEGKPYALFVSAGNDGRGAIHHVERIAQGYTLRKVHEPIVCRGELSNHDLKVCEEFGETIAAGIDLGIF